MSRQWVAPTHPHPNTRVAHSHRHTHPSIHTQRNTLPHTDTNVHIHTYARTQTHAHRGIPRTLELKLACAANNSLVEVIQCSTEGRQHSGGNNASEPGCGPDPTSLPNLEMLWFHFAPSIFVQHVEVFCPPNPVSRTKARENGTTAPQPGVFALIMLALMLVVLVPFKHIRRTHSSA